MMTRGRKPRPGRITFVGSGPGDPGLLTTRAAAVLANAALVFTDPDVPEPVLALIGKDLPPVSGPVPADPAAGSDGSGAAADNTNPAAAAGVPGAPDIRPALGDPAEVAKTLTAEARAGVDVVRLVAGDPLSVDAVITEVNAVARTHLHIEIVPGLAATSAVPTYAGLPLGSSHTVADVRGEVDWEALAAAPGPLILQATASHLADAARTLVEHELADTTPCVVTAQGTTCQQRSVETTLLGLTDPTILGGTDSRLSPASAGDPLSGPLVVTIGKTVASRAKLNWWESRALYGWTVLVPRTKDQAGEMSERLTSYGALPIEVPTIAVEPPRSPAQMERAVKGLVDGRFQWVVFTSTNAVRAVWEKFGEFGLDARAFSGVKIACVGESTADRVRAFGISPELVPAGEQSSIGLLDEFPPYDSIFDPVNRVLAAARRHRHRNAGRGTARAWLGDRGRHRLPDGARRAAAGGHPRNDQDGRLRRGVLHLQLHGAKPGRHRRQAARADHHRLHRPQDRGDRGRVRPAGGCPARHRRGGPIGRRTGRTRRPIAGRGCTSTTA